MDVEDEDILKIPRKPGLRPHYTLFLPSLYSHYIIVFALVKPRKVPFW